MFDLFIHAGLPAVTVGWWFPLYDVGRQMLLSVVICLIDMCESMSIAKALVETQGGRIWVESEPGVGSSFSFILPLSFEDEEDLVSSLSIPDPFAGIIESAEGDQ